MVHGRPADVERGGKRTEVGVGKTAPERSRVAQSPAEARQTPRSLEPGDGRQLTIRRPHRAGQVGLLGIHEPVETCLDIASDAMRLELQDAAVGADQSQQSGDLLVPLEVDDVAATSLGSQGADAQRGERRLELLGRGPPAKDELDVRARWSERQRSSAQEGPAQERAAVAGGGAGPRPGPERSPVHANRDVVPASRSGSLGEDASGRIHGHPQRRREVDDGSRNGVVEGPKDVTRGVVQKTLELGATVAVARRLNPGELAPNLGREEHGGRQEACAAGRWIRRRLGRSTRSSWRRRMSAVASFAGS